MGWRWHNCLAAACKHACLLARKLNASKFAQIIIVIFCSRFLSSDSSSLSLLAGWLAGWPEAAFNLAQLNAAGSVQLVEVRLAKERLRGEKKKARI